MPSPLKLFAVWSVCDCGAEILTARSAETGTTVFYPHASWCASRIRKLRHPVKLGKRHYPVGTAVQVATLAEVQEIFPQMTKKADSAQIGVWFPGMAHPTIVKIDQLDS